MVVLEQSSKSFVALNVTVGLVDVLTGVDEPIAQPPEEVSAAAVRVVLNCFRKAFSEVV
jgi:hypothetical protein